MRYLLSLSVRSFAKARIEMHRFGLDFLCILVLLNQVLFFVSVHGASIHGTNDIESYNPNLRVLVHSSQAIGAGSPRSGSQFGSRFVENGKGSNQSFTLEGLDDGDHIVELCGAPAGDYPHMRVSVREGKVTHVEARRDPLLIPGGFARKEADAVAFVKFADSQFEASAYTWKALIRKLRKPFVIFQLFAVFFVIWFPRFVSGLDPDILYEMTGEEPPRIGDPNALLKKLIGFEEETVGAVDTAAVAPASSQK